MLAAGLVLCAPARRTYAAVSATRATSRPILSAGFPIEMSLPGLHRVVVAQQRRGVFVVGGTLTPSCMRASTRGAFVGLRENSRMSGAFVREQRRTLGHQSNASAL